MNFQGDDPHRIGSSGGAAIDERRRMSRNAAGFPASPALLPGPVPVRSALRVAVLAVDPATARRLRALVSESGHAVVAAGEAADALLSDGSAPPAADLPTVACGAAGGEFAGLLPRGVGPVALDAALRAVAAGLVVRPRRIGKPLEKQLDKPLGKPAARPRFEPLPDATLPRLTPREIEVLTAFGDGLSNKETARRLGISPHTVKFHGESLFRKLGAGCRAEAVAKGLRRQIVEF
jgi:two-component system, NarL family, nitrate/nitrite response regulator NarL